jgi:hypothetical protein
VALHTLRRRSSKNALQVAPLTHDLRMTAAEREASAAVIDFNICADTPLGKSGIRRQQSRATYRQKSTNNCPGKEPTSCPAKHSTHSCIPLAQLANRSRRFQLGRKSRYENRSLHESDQNFVGMRSQRHE